MSGCRDEQGEFASSLLEFASWVSRGTSARVCGGLHPALRRCLVWRITASGRFSSREITSSRLLWIRLPWSVLWQPELRERVGDQPRARGQVADRPDSQPNYPPRLESQIKTEVHFLFGCACLSAGPSCLSRIVKCFCCTLFAFLTVVITLPLHAPLVSPIIVK